MTSQDSAIMALVKQLSAQPQTDESQGLLNKLASMIIHNTPEYEGMGETFDEMVKRRMGW